MTIIRVEKNENYTVLPNQMLNDSRLSLEARGLLAYLLSKPNHWIVNSRALEHISPAGRGKIQRILRELEQYGYLERRRVHGEGGRFTWESIIRESPLQETATTMAGFSGHGKKKATSRKRGDIKSSETMAGFSMDGKSMDGKSMDGKSMDGKSMDGKSMDGKSMDGKSMDGKSMDGKPGHIVNTDIVNTDIVNTDRVNTATTTTKPDDVELNTQASPPEAPVTVAVVAEPELPEDIARALDTLGWVGSMAEIAHAWQADPERVRAWLGYAQREGLGAGWLRKTLRENPGYPPKEPGAVGTKDYLGPMAEFFENFEDDEADGGDAGGNLDPGKDGPNLSPQTRQWWQIVLGDLRRELPKAPFDTWVRDAQVVAFDGEVFTVGTYNAYARDWLADRLAKILEHKLSGLAGKPVQVRFVVVEEKHA